MRSPTRLAMLTLTTLAALAPAAPAAAGVVEFETPAHVPMEVVFTDETGEANSVTVTQSADEIVVRDSSAPVSVRSGCTQRGPNEAVCPIALSVRLELGEGDDSTLLSSVRGYATIRGGPGDDLIRGTGVADNLYGGGGQDRIFGFGGDDRISDQDVSAPEPRGTAPDTLVGGAGNDRVDYTDRSRNQPVSIDLARQLGAGDTIREIERVRTGPADDTIAGDGAVNTFDGGGGRDTLIGRGGADDLTIRGAGVVRGGRGDDWIWVRARGARSRISCGAGHDHAASFTSDLLGRDCEHANAGAATIGLERLRGTRRALRRHGGLRFQVDCVAGGRCAGRLRLLRPDGTVASRARYSVSGRGKSYALFPLRAADRRRVARGRTFTFAGPRPASPGFRMLVILH
jgi:hypothetical protein